MDGLTDSAKSSYGYRLTKLDSTKIYLQDNQFFSKISSLNQAYLVFPVSLSVLSYFSSKYVLLIIFVSLALSVSTVSAASLVFISSGI